MSFIGLVYVSSSHLLQLFRRIWQYFSAVKVQKLFVALEWKRSPILPRPDISTTFYDFRLNLRYMFTLL